MNIRLIFFCFCKSEIYGLCCLLKYPYQKIESIISINQYGLSELDRSQLVSIELLHRGNDNEIYKGTYGQRDVIIKYMNMDNQNNINQFLDQTKIMKEFSHKNLVHFYGVCTQDKPILIVTEFMIHGCLLKYLRDQSRINLKLKTIVDFIRQVNDEEICLGKISFMFRL
jgi:serine/threonine protein kinase